MRIRGAASLLNPRGCLLEETRSCGGTGISTPPAASSLRAGPEAQPIATGIRLLCEHRR
jgi:hypothetical protein